jgi:hypothetical protein
MFYEMFVIDISIGFLQDVPIILELLHRMSMTELRKFSVWFG